METALVSFIGKAREDRSGARRYLKTPYRFEDDRVFEATFFGSALLSYLDHKVERACFVGTTGSTWSELVELIPVHRQEEFLPFMESLENASPSELNERLRSFEEALDRILPYRIKLLCVPDEPYNHSAIRDILLSAFADFRGRVIFDITHAYRYMPYIALLTLLPLRYLGINEISIYYGFLEKPDKQGTTPVIRLDLAEELIRITENLSTFANTGDFSPLGAFLFPEKADLFYRAYFKVETNQPARELREISGILETSSYTRSIRDEIRGLVSSKTLEDRMARRARFFFERRQYLKAVTLLYEAVLIKALNFLQGVRDKRSYESREEAKRWLWRRLSPERKETFRLLKSLRNAVAHGTVPENLEEAGKIHEMLNDENKFRAFFEEALRFYENLGT